MRAVLALAAPVVFVLAACGDDDGGADPAPFVEALSEDIQSGEDDEFSLDDEAADCVAAAIVDTVGADRLEEEGIEPDELADADSLDDLDVSIDDEAVEELGDALGDCDLEGSLIEGFVGSAGFELSSDATACLQDAVVEDLGSALASVFADEDDSAGVQALFVDAFGACPDATAEAFAAGIEQELGGPLSEEALDCIAEQVEADPEGAAQAFAGGGSDAEAIGEEIGLACLQELGG